MSGAVAGFTFFGVWLTAALWAALDSEARGRNPFIWGLLTLFFGPFALGAYAVTGDRDTRSSPLGRRRTYFFTAAFFFLGVSYASMVALLAVALDVGVSNSPIDSDSARTATAILLAVLIFAVPLWTFHWVQALGLMEKQHGDFEDRALFLLIRRYGAVVLVTTGLVTIGFGIYLVFTALSAIMDVYRGDSDQFLPVLAFLPLTILLMVYHWMAIFGSSKYRALANRFEDAPEPDAPAPAEQPGTPA